MTTPADPTTGQGLTERERKALDQSLADSGCHGFLGDHPDLYAAVEAILARRVRSAAEEGERRGGVKALREAAEEANRLADERPTPTGYAAQRLRRTRDWLRDRAAALASGRAAEGDEEPTETRVISPNPGSANGYA